VLRQVDIGINVFDFSLNQTYGLLKTFVEIWTIIFSIICIYRWGLIIFAPQCRFLILFFNKRLWLMQVRWNFA